MLKLPRSLEEESGPLGFVLGGVKSASASLSLYVYWDPALVLVLKMADSGDVGLTGLPLSPTIQSSFRRQLRVDNYCNREDDRK